MTRFAPAAMENGAPFHVDANTALGPLNPTYLMCAPAYFEVSYVINPWMAGNISRGNHSLAQHQWAGLVEAMSRVANIVRIQPEAGVPDLVFTANAGVVRGQKVVLSRFRHVERQAEESHFEDWFATHGFEVLKMPTELPFEGAGDALLDRHDDLLWFGHGHRSDGACAEPLSRLLEVEVQPLRLVDPRFYHLDTCFCPLDGGKLLYFPEAFDIESQAEIAARVPAHRRLIVSAADALDFACNSVNSGAHIFLNRASPSLVAMLKSHGYRVMQTPLTEFLKAGGAAKCLTLKLNEPLSDRKYSLAARCADAVDAD